MAMRITNNMIVNKFTVNLQKNLLKQSKFTQQLSTGRRIVNISDDPVGVLDTMMARTRLADIARYQDNLQRVKSWNDAADTALQQISSHMTSTLENLIQGATDLYNDTDRQNLAKDVEGLRKTILETLNAAVNEQYIFAGYNINNPPFTEDANGKVLYNGIDLTDTGTQTTLDKIQHEQTQQVQIETGYELMMDMSMIGIDVVGTGDNNLFKTLDDILELLNGNDPDAATKLGAKIEDLRKAHENVLTCIVKIGAEESRYDMLSDRYGLDELNYTEIKSTVEDIDSAETIMYWKMAEAVYNQCLAVGSRVIQPTLLDFLGS